MYIINTKLFICIVNILEIMALSILDALRQAPANSRELQSATGLSQTTVSRQLRSFGDQVVRLGAGRATRYALVRNAFNSGNNLPLFTVDPHGNTVLIANVRPLAHGGYLVIPTTGTPTVLLGENGDGIYDDLPYFLEDLRPQGYLGRQVAQALAERSDYPPDPRQWSAEQVGSYLIANGDDLPGNFKLGMQNVVRLPRPFQVSNRENYPDMAESVIRGNIPGSSAGGEQPKFTAYTEDHGHVIVKFSPLGDDQLARRWRDILLTEFCATQLLKSALCPAADVHLYELGGRLFLESQRFDRHGETGRMPMISLQTIDAEFIGLGSNWAQVMSSLASKELVSQENVFDAIALSSFGRGINNTDMHLGNLSLAFEGDVFRLLPAYDMCSMGFAPSAGGEVRPFSYALSVTLDSETPDPIISGLELAHIFWDKLHEDDRISDELRVFLDRGNPVRIEEVKPGAEKN